MNPVTEVTLAEIEVPENRLRELRDYSGLAASMAEIGLLQPITVTDEKRLVAGRHRLEAARSLGWESIAAFVVEDDDLANRLAEIDENLRRLDLTVYEQAKHAEERERVLEAMGRRQKPGGDRRSESSRNDCGVKATAEVANEAGMSERSWQQRTKIGRSLGDKARTVLDMADPTEEKHRNFLNSTTQLNHLADISNKRGDESAAETAEKVLNGEHKSTFDAYPEVKTRTVGDLVGSGEDFEIPPRKLSPEQKAFYEISAYLVRLRRMDPEKVAEEWLEQKDHFEAQQQTKDARFVVDWFSRYDEAMEQISKRHRREAGNLRVVGEE